MIDKALEKIEMFLRDGRQHYIVLPYADFLVRARKDEGFKKILNCADLSLSDGIGPVLASYLIGYEFLEGRARPQRSCLRGGRVMGVDLIWAIFEKLGASRKVFLFGAKEGIAQKAAQKVWQQEPSARIVGIANGYVSDKEAIDLINCSEAEILLVALGMPKQEKWIYDNLKMMPSIKIAIGVGGAFDFISGHARRAPRVIQKMGLEWLWRLFVRPSRWRKTWRSVFVFSAAVLKEKFL